jgi:hypothetical protein
MKEPANCLIFCLAILLLVIGGVTGQTQSAKVVSGGTLIDVTRGASIADAVIVIEGTRITQVGTNDNTKDKSERLFAPRRHRGHGVQNLSALCVSVVNFIVKRGLYND